MPDTVSPTRLLPTGTITFLFTDIEGSTKLLEQLRERYAIILAESSDILRTLADKFGGVEVDTAGDSFFLVFPRALNAGLFAFSAQRALAAHTWPDGVNVKIRMGLHTGQAIVSRTGYVGMDVHRGARIMASAHGGQVVLSSTTGALLEGELPAGITLRELGEYNLKDVGLTQIFQLDIEGLEQSFPPLKTLDIQYQAPAPGAPPFMGLRYFDTADAPLFFGRKAITTRLIERLQQEKFLAVVGASGSGKSSIVRAGIIPALHDTWVIHVITPTANPLFALAGELTRNIVSVTATATLMDDLSRDPRSLALYLQRHPSTETPHTLLFIDQFEELFTLNRDENARLAFIQNILNAAAQDAATVILTLRADFYASLADYAELRETVSQHQEYIGLMSQGELQSAIQEPAKQNGWEFDAGLVELILHDVGQEPGALPLLSHALLETWNRRSGTRLMLKSYEESGGVRGAIAKTAERVFYQELDPDEQNIARNIFLRLTELGEGTQDTRRRACLSELLPRTPYARVENVQRVLQHLVDARLITTDEGVAQVAHEALIREWHTLREWLTQDREGLRLHRHLTEAAQEWVLFERDSDALYRGARLVQAQEFASAHPERINQSEREFLDASIADAERAEQEKEAVRQRELEQARKLAETESKRAEEQRRGALRLRWFAAGLALLLIAALAAAYFAFNSSNVAQTNFITAESIRLASQAQIALDNGEGGDLPALLSLQSLKLGYSPDADASLLNAVKRGFTKQIFLGNADLIWDADFSPDGKFIATAGQDATARIYDVQTGKELLKISPPVRIVNAIEYSPDGNTFVTGNPGDTFWLWDAMTGKQLQSFDGNVAGAWEIKFSPDGRYLASGDDGVTHLWDVKTGHKVRDFNAHIPGTPQGVSAVAFSPDGAALATGEADSTIRVWNVADGQELYRLNGDAGSIFAEFSPNGKTVLGVSGNNVNLWSTETHKQTSTLVGHADLVTWAVFSPDGRSIATASHDKTARLWDVETAQETHRFIGHTGAIYTVAFSPDGKSILTGSTDRSARLWDLQAESEPHTYQANDELTAVYAGSIPMALSPDGKYVATMGGKEERNKSFSIRNIETNAQFYLRPASTPNISTISTYAISPDDRFLLGGGDDGVLWMWEMQGGKKDLRQTGHTAKITSLIFSSDGRKFLSSSEDNTARLWDTQTGKTLQTFQGHTKPVRVVALSPDQKFVLTGSDDKTVRLWDAQSGSQVRQFDGHTGPVRSVAFSSDGKFIVTGSDDKSARLWDAQTGKELRQFIGHTAQITRVAFSLDGQFLLTGSTDQTARLWNSQTGTLLRNFVGHVSPILYLGFTNGGRTIITGDSENAYRWRSSLDDVITFTCSQLNRDLTTDERTLYRITDTTPACPKFAKTP